MKLQRIRIQNFRGIKDLTLDLDDTVVLIGENNSGKTAVLTALRLCLRDGGPRGGPVFDALDFHLEAADSDPAGAPPICITLTFAESTMGEWAAPLVARLNQLKILQVDGATGLSSVVMRVMCEYNAAERDLKQTTTFLNTAGEPLTVSNAAAMSLRREVEYFYLPALRDAGRHFDAKGRFWRPFLRDGQLPAEQKAEIESRLKEINDLVVGSHKSFEQARSELNEVQKIVPLAAGEAVSIDAIPARMFDVLSKAQIQLGTFTGANVPVGRHGEGTQSLAVLLLFSAFLKTWRQGAPLVALEEPEAHLHPSAVRSLWALVQNGIAGQKLISTHSGDLLSQVDILQVRRLARTSSGIQAYRLPDGVLSAEEMRKFNYHIRRARGELLFARCWLLVEGETESWIYPAAARATGRDLEREGVRLVEFSQSDLAAFTKVANALGIPWYCVLDDDSGRKKYEGAVKENLAGASITDRLGLPYNEIEAHLLENGYEAEYKPFMSRQKLKEMTAKPGEHGYWKRYAECLSRKSRAAAAVAMEMERRGKSGVTTQLDEVLNKVISLAGVT